MVDVRTCPSCGRPRTGSLDSIGNPGFCWKTDEYCTQYERDTKPYRDRVRALEAELAELRKRDEDVRTIDEAGSRFGTRLDRLGGIPARLPGIDEDHIHFVLMPIGAVSRRAAAAWVREQKKGAGER